MESPDCDLQNYQLARQLHLMSHLYEVFLTNTMSYPLFYDSLHPVAKQRARTVLLALHRLFETSARDGASLFTRSPYRLYTMRSILSFLVYSECPVTWPSCVSRQLRDATAAAAAPSVTPQATPRHTATVPSSLDATPLRLDAGTEGGAPVPTTPTPGSGSSTAEQTVLTGAPVRSPLQQPMPPLTLAAAAAAAPVPLTDIMVRPLFFLRPFNDAATDRTTPHFGTTTQLYVRMIHPHPLNEESLNPYFGRYGQVDCTAIQRTPLPQYTAHLGEAAAEALYQLFAPTSATDSATLYVQDFIISVDSHQNAVHAVRRAYYRELACIALHDPAGTRNTHCLADVNLWMRRHAFVWRLRAEATLSAADKAEAKDGAATAAAAVARQRKRTRAKQRLQERRRKRRAVLGDGGDSSSSSPASSAGRRGRDSDGDKSSGSESDGGSSSSGTSRSSSDGSGGEDDLAQFVPDIVLDGFPYWTTEDQLKVLLQDYGTVVELRLSLDDLSGAFTGCVLVRMASLEEALHVSRALHGTLHRGHRLVSGVINERLEVVALEDAEEVRVAAVPEQVPYDVSLNERVWV